MKFATIALALLSAAPALAQDARYVWSGVVFHDGKPTGKRIDPEDETTRASVEKGKPAEQFLKELEEIRLQLEVDGKLEEARKKLDDLRIRASWAVRYAGRMGALVEIARTRVEVLARLGDIEGAIGATRALLVDEGAKATAGGYELVPADAQTLEQERFALADAERAGLWAQLARSIGRADPAVQGGAIEEAVRKALESGQPNLVTDIGPRAAPALEKLVLAEPDTLPASVQGDPLQLLFALSELRGARLVLDHWEAGGFFWHKRILRAMKFAHVLENAGTWQEGASDDSPPRLLEPAWLEVLTRLLEDRLVGREALVFVSFVAMRDALSRELQQALARTLSSRDMDLVKEGTSLLGSAASRATIKPVLEGLLKHPEGDLRRFAADRLLDYKGSDALLACVDHQDPAVRAGLARSLRKHKGLFVQYSGKDPTSLGARDVLPDIGPQERAALVRLYSDADPSVRAEAAFSIEALKEPLEDAVYLRMAEDPSAEVRTNLAKWRDAPASLRMRLFGILARDRDPAVLRELDQTAARADYTEPQRDEVHSIVRARYENKAAPFELSDGRRGEWLLAAALRSRAGVLETTRWALGTMDGDLLDTVIRQIAGDPPGRIGELGHLDDAALAGLYRAAFFRPRDLFYRLDRGVAQLDRELPKYATGLVRIAADEGLPLVLRLHAAKVVAPQGGEAFERALFAILEDPRWADGIAAEEGVYAAYPLGRRLVSTDRNRILQRAFDSRISPNALLLAVAGGALDMPPEILFEKDLARVLVERCFPVRMNHFGLVDDLLRLLPPGIDAATSRTLIDASGEPPFAITAIETMGRIRDPAFLDALGERLLVPKTADASELERTQIAAAGALTSYMSDAAAERLLVAVGASSSEKVRKACLDGLDAIRRYQDETARWNARKGGQQAREEAIAQLLPMLEDEDAIVRAHAARSLGTLQAVEHLPRLVKLLKDRIPSVQNAAKEALERLNAPEAKKP